MVRLSIGAAAIIMMVGCTGLIDSHNNGQTPEQAIALEQWNTKAYPVLKTECVTCHNEAMMDQAPGFLIGNGDPLAIRTTLLGFKDDVVNLNAPPSSQLLTKGLHNGPALTAQEASDILEWIKAEAAATASTGDTGSTLELFTPLVCTSGAAGDTTGCATGGACCPFNLLDLTSLGLPGATLKFIWQKLDDTDSYVNRLEAIPAPAPATDGMYMEHPLFVSWPVGGGEPKPDNLDRFIDIKLNLTAGTSSTLDGGAAAFIGFAPTDKLSIHFKHIEKFHTDTGTTMPAGCKQLASFKTNAQGQFNTNCASCHAGTANAGAHSAVNMDGLAATDDPTIMNVCNELRVFANLQDTTNAPIYLTPNPATGGNHPFKFGGNQAAFNAFQAAVDVWVQAEKTSP